jgi:predicted 2-oxoglutarate/Fe(II)-dependent dioxygenase YbiX
MERRARDNLLPALPAGYAAIVANMPHIIRRLLVENDDLRSWTLEALDHAGSTNEWASKLPNHSLYSEVAALSVAQCAALREAIDSANTHEGDVAYPDSVDGQLEHQLTLSDETFAELVGDQALPALAALAARCHQTMRAPRSAEADAAAHAAGVCHHGTFPNAPHDIFVRKYSPSSRPFCGFHHDRSTITVNIALSDDALHSGGRLLAVMDGRVQRCDQRLEGTASVHASTLLHAVTRITHGTRYSLILFYRRTCPDASPKHDLVRCDAITMGLLYPCEYGSYSCDVCGFGADEMAFPAMWRCAEGCNYDVCDACHD